MKYDDALGKFYVYNRFPGTVDVRSRADLLGELKNLQEMQLRAPSEAFDREWFERSRKAYISRLIEIYGSDESAD